MKKIYLGLMVTAALLGGNVAAYADDASVESFNSQGHGVIMTMVVTLAAEMVAMLPVGKCSLTVMFIPAPVK